ncbi:MAG: DUF1667 domain-containing protein [Tissierellia bacterium]|nr:DUF1667 domain-containing protein [Tissierellia bacterium]
MKIQCKNCKIGCELWILDGKVTGNRCSRGLSYAHQEETSIFYTRVSFVGTAMSKLAVKSSRPLTEEEKEKVSTFLAEAKVLAPVEAGEIVLKNVGNMDVDFISQRRMK